MCSYTEYTACNQNKTVKGSLSTVASLLVLANVVIAGCSTLSFTTSDDGIVHWFDPNAGEIRDPLDCAGGHAPPKTNVPGCAGWQMHSFPYDDHEYSDTSRYWKQHHAFNHFAPSQSSNSTTHGNGTSSTSGTAAPSSPTNNKGHMLDGSLIAVAGAAIGAVALI
ncbi:uncharacterized protein P174DRAFT_507628 [Aspergillus novofumigatus IBT 16806]|uniref:Uncharacterized protein n=1 Tax=Aspergillus novofumigatus (strain IBT 16806) TaxID=1392255 RepID=A0A2I1BVC6_ASPN1|nr:uncharacterized protein P174DRAFT_507628 [Aspergillus novofumigatus IBT 16806]PKX89319.1 hypothetical protein P174DRAFT_507628 [Aspergillus novofumigatus IBT 16806]